MNRRNFIRTIAGVGTGTLVAGTGYVASIGFYDVVDRIVRRELHYLSISEAVFSTFIEDAKREKPFDYYGSEKQWFARFHFMSGKAGAYFLPYRYKYEQYCNEFVGVFLLSTSFFVNKMDETKPIVYTGLYQPYRNACSNPFSSLYYA
jgi:hypothetical protein